MAKQIKYAQVLLTYPQCDKPKEDLLEWIKTIDGVQSAIVCHENHHETDGEHLHAWVKFINTQRIGKGKWGTLFDWNGIHGHYDKVTCSTRSIADTVKYVMKDGDTIVWNCDTEALMNPGKSHQRKYDNEKILETPMKQLVDEGVINIKDVPQYLRGIQAYKLLEKPKEKKKCRGIWLTGKAGCGKSTWAHMLGEHLGGYYEKAQNKWWDGYDKEKVVVLDDLDTEALLHYLKIWSDKFPCKGEVKGSTVWLHHDWFVVTSNFTIRDICSKTGETDKFYDALKRRFHELSLPYDAEFFQFDKDCDWTNPDVEDTTPPPTKQQPPEPTEPTIASFMGSGYD
uniref:Replication-associated protein n=1 Tax=Cressdnaviricota sp. TaxID=2748378 RepID=A0A8K1JGU0_9VIRU|nr:MAG: replication-associated protein [Cressdnaviricota sp.]